jgi:hypothetical protein
MTHPAYARCPRCGGILDSLGRCDCDYRRGWGGAILAARSDGDGDGDSE